jgi:hypothetical protein
MLKTGMRSNQVENNIGSERQTGQERQAPKLMQRVSDTLKTLHYSPRTAEAYLTWVETVHRFSWNAPSQPGRAGTKQV